MWLMLLKLLKSVCRNTCRAIIINGILSLLPMQPPFSGCKRNISHAFKHLVQVRHEKKKNENVELQRAG